MLLAGLGGFVYLDRAAKRPAPPPPPLTGPAKAYVKSLKLSDVDMKANESYMQQAIVVEITGKIENAGDRVLEVVEINCVLLTTRLAGRMGIARAGADREPEDRRPGAGRDQDIPHAIPGPYSRELPNQALPQMVIARIDFT